MDMVDKVSIEGDLEEAIDEICSICHEDFCESNRSTLTECEHEFHLNCILDWCKRRSYCPLCMKDVRLSDPASHELLKKVEGKRSLGSPVVPNASSGYLWSNDADSEDELLLPSKIRKTEVGKAGLVEPVKGNASKIGLPVEALDMLPPYIAATLNAMNKAVGIIDAERLVKKSDREVLNLSVSHLLKAAILMVEHERRAVELSQINNELLAAKKEIASLGIEKAKIQGDLYRAQLEVHDMRREKSNALKKASRAAKAKEEINEQLRQLKADVATKEEQLQQLKVDVATKEEQLQQLKADVGSKEEQAVATAKEFEVLKHDLKKEKARALKRVSQVGQETVKLKAEMMKTVPTMNNE